MSMSRLGRPSTAADKKKLDPQQKSRQQSALSNGIAEAEGWHHQWVSKAAAENARKHTLAPRPKSSIARILMQDDDILRKAFKNPTKLFEETDDYFDSFIHLLLNPKAEEAEAEGIPSTTGPAPSEGQGAAQTLPVPESGQPVTSPNMTELGTDGDPLSNPRGSKEVVRAALVNRWHREDDFEMRRHLPATTEYCTKIRRPILEHMRLERPTSAISTYEAMNRPSSPATLRAPSPEATDAIRKSEGEVHPIPADDTTFSFLSRLPSSLDGLWKRPEVLQADATPTRAKDGSETPQTSSLAGDQHSTGLEADSSHGVKKVSGLQIHGLQLGLGRNRRVGAGPALLNEMPSKMPGRKLLEEEPKPTYFAELFLDEEWFNRKLGHPEDLPFVQAEIDRLTTIPGSGNVKAEVVISKESYCLIIHCSNALCGLKALHSAQNNIAKGKSRQKILRLQIIPKLDRDKMLNESPRHVQVEEEIYLSPEEIARLKKLKQRKHLKKKGEYDAVFDDDEGSALHQLDHEDERRIALSSSMGGIATADEAEAFIKPSGLDKFRRAVKSKIIQGLKMAANANGPGLEAFDSWKAVRSSCKRYAVVVAASTFSDPNLGDVPQIGFDGAALAARLTNFGFTVDLMDPTQPEFLQPSWKNLHRVLRHVTNSVDGEDAVVIAVILGLGIANPNISGIPPKTPILLLGDTTTTTTTAKNVMTMDKFTHFADQFGNQPWYFIDAHPIPNSALSDGMGLGWGAMKGRPGPGGELQVTYSKGQAGWLTYYLDRALEGFSCCTGSGLVDARTVVTQHMISSFLSPRLEHRGCQVVTNAHTIGTINIQPLMSFSLYDNPTRPSLPYGADFKVSLKNRQKGNALRVNLKLLVRLGDNVKPSYSTSERDWFAVFQKEILKQLGYTGKKPKMPNMVDAPRKVWYHQNYRQLLVEFRDAQDISKLPDKRRQLVQEIGTLLKQTTTAFKLPMHGSQALGFLPGLALGRTEISIPSGAPEVYQYLVNQMVGVVSERVIRKPKSLFAIVDCAIVCCERDARKLHRIARQQALYQLVCIQSVSIDPYPLKIHAQVTKAQATARAVIECRKFQARLKQIRNSRDQKGVLFEQFCTELGKIFLQFQRATLLALESEEASVRKFHIFEQKEDRARIITIRIRDTAVVEARERLMLELREDLYFFQSREAILRKMRAKNSLRHLEYLISLHKINLAATWQHFYIQLSEYQETLQIRNYWRQYLRFTAKIEAPNPPSTAFDINSITVTEADHNGGAGGGGVTPREKSLLTPQLGLHSAGGSSVETLSLGASQLPPAASDANGSPPTTPQLKEKAMPYQRSPQPFNLDPASLRQLESPPGVIPVSPAQGGLSPHAAPLVLSETLAPEPIPIAVVLPPPTPASPPAPTRRVAETSGRELPAFVVLPSQLFTPKVEPRSPGLGSTTSSNASPMGPSKPKRR